MYPSHCQRVIKIHLKKKKRILPSSIAITIHHWGGKKVSAIIRFADTRQKEERKWQQSEKESEGRKENGERGQVEEAERLATGEGGPGERRQGRGIYYQGFTVITRRGRSTRAARGAAYVCGVVRLSDARTSVYIYVYIYVYTCSQNIHGRVHVTWISWIRKLDVPRLLATAVCPTSALCRVSMHYALRN